MTRLIPLSIGGATLLAGIIAVASAQTAPAAAFARLVFNGDGGAKAAASLDYPVRIELPVSTAAADAARGPASIADPSVVDTLPEIESAIERVDQWTMDEPKLAALSPPRSDVSAPVRSARPGVVSARFEIATFGRVATASDNEVRARKPLVVSGEKIGAIELAMGQGSIVSVDRQELSDLVGNRAPALSAALARLEGDRVTFDTVRTREIRIRYDALSDTVVIETRS